MSLLQEINGRGGSSGHFDFDLVIGPGLVAELAGDVIAQRQDLLQQRDVLRAGQVVVLDEQLLARFLAFGVVHHAEVVPGDVRHDGVFVGAGLDLRQEALRHAFQLGLGELHGLLGLGDVGLEIGRQPAQLLAHPLHLVALGLGQIQTGPAIIAHGLGQQLGILPFKLGLPVGVGLERLVDVLPIVDADGPFLQLLEGVGGGVAQRGVGAGFLDQPEAVVREADLIADVVQGADGVLERDLAGLEGAEAIQGGVADRDRLPEGEADAVGRRLKLRHGDDGVKGGGALLELAQSVGLIGWLSHAAERRANDSQQKQVIHFQFIRPASYGLRPSQSSFLSLSLTHRGRLRGRG